MIASKLDERFLPPAFAGDNSAAQPSRSAELLSQDRKIHKTISRGEAQLYALTLDANQYAQVLVEPQGIALRLTVIAPDGQTALSLNTRLREATPLSFIAAGHGDFRVEVRTQENSVASGNYELSIAELRLANTQDRSRIEAGRLFREAARLRSLPDKKDRREALEKYKAALKLSRQAHDGKGEADALNGLSEAAHAIGDDSQSLKHAEEALLRSQSLKYLAGEAEAAWNVGEAQYYLGERRAALKLYEQALSLWQGLGEAREQVQTLWSYGYAFADLGEINEALNAFQQAISLCDSLNDMQGKALIQTAMGDLNNKQGKRQEALDLYTKALKLLEQLDENKRDKKTEAMVMTGFGFVHEKMGEPTEAIYYYGLARKLYQSIDDDGGEASVMLRMGETYFSTGDLPQALDYYNQSLALFRAANNSRTQSFLLRDIGALYAAWGKPQEALDYYQQSRRLLKPEEDRRAASLTLNGIGRVYESLGEKRRALDYYQQALKLNRITQDHWAESQSLYNLAHAERGLGNLAEARKQIVDSLVIVESLRTEVASYDLRASYFATVRQYYELDIDVLMQLHRENPTAGYAALALQASEKARARSLLDILAQGNGSLERGGDPALNHREEELRQELNAKDERRVQLLAGKAAKEEVSNITEEIERLALEYEAIKTKIRESSPRYAALIEPRILSLEDMQALLDDQTVMLQYALGEERSYLWVLSQKHLESYELPTRAEIENLALEVRKAMLARQPVENETQAARSERIREADKRYEEQSAALSANVLAPAAAAIHDKRLLIIPDAALQYVSFEALPEPKADEAQAAEPTPLMFGHEIIYQPSASALALLLRETSERQPAPKTIAALADPVFEQDDSRIKRANNQPAQPAPEPPTEAGNTRGIVDTESPFAGGKFPRLQETRAEVEAIFKEVPVGGSFKAIGFEATKKLATSPELAQYRIVHFATHGVLDSKHSELSGLVLSRFDQNGQAQDGLLRLTDIYNLHLPVELVVLSACNTGLGKDIKGEGLVGLTRGFMYAGAPRVMASLWKVDDAATAELMKHFYRGLLRDRLTPAAALRQAQITLWQQKKWHEPYFWAAFILQGEYKQSIPTAPQDSRRSMSLIAVLVGFTIAISLGGIYAARYRRSRIARAGATGL